jgi:hypothetical protein
LRLFRDPVAINKPRLLVGSRGEEAGMGDGSAERMAANEATFREANERIQQRAQELEFSEPVPFLCECGEPGCREILRLTLGEYEQVRGGGGARFFVLPGHEDVAGSSGRVCERKDGFVVVEKVGKAAAVAEERDPRQPSGRS